MKKVVINICVASTLLCALLLSCYSTGSSDGTSDADIAAISPTTEQYFEGNLCYSLTTAFFEESISGVVLSVDMTGLPFVIETEFPQINEKKGEPIHVKLKGYLTPKETGNPDSEMLLTIKDITEIKSNKRPLEPMTGIYYGDGHMLTISPNRTYTLLEKSGKATNGNWFLHSKSTMILLSENSKTVMRVNYKKKSLNSKDDHPTIFTLSPTLSNR